MICSRSTARVTATAATSTLVLFLALPAAARNLVSANPHAPSLPAGGTPPQAGIASLGNVHVNAYHVSSAAEVGRALGYSSYGKPKILSDDAGGVTPAMANAWIDQTCAAGEHYEHFDAAIGGSAMSGAVIDSLADFPAASRQVLRHIRDSSCVSDLEPNGTLTVSGREFFWNGRQVNLVGHSWMGALSGLNFDIDGYLDVLASFRVNLTRVWVIEQWTALLVEKTNPPHPANAVMPFSGAIDFNGPNDTLDLLRINPAFLARLRSFVQKAAQRGIVVQLTLFDRHGLRNFPDFGRWSGSPYNVANNRNPFFTPGAAQQAPPDFMDVCLVAFLQGQEAVSPGPVPAGVELCPDHALANLQLIFAVASEVGSYGNVIFEVMNEPLTQPTESWTLSDLVGWTSWVAGMVNPSSQLPPTQ